MPPPDVSDTAALTPGPAAVARFADDLTTALGRPPAGDKAVVAVSGGPDSMALLLLAHAAMPGRVLAATFDHRLRAGSADEAQMVARVCGILGVRHAVLTPDVPLPPTNVQAAARAARYAALRRWADAQRATMLLTAHHADDQAETFLMRANRGSGLGGLAGVRRRVAGAVTVVRPLLGWRRTALRAIVAAAGVPFVDDPSNSDPRFDRARLRGWMERQDQLDPAALARSAAYLSEVEADLIALNDWLWRERALVAAGTVRIDVANLPRTMRRMLLHTAIAEVGGAAGGGNVEALLDTLIAGGTGTHAGVLGRADGDIWCFRIAPPRRSH